jgi:hypothetical protein
MYCDHDGLPEDIWSYDSAFGNEKNAKTVSLSGTLQIEIVLEIVSSISSSRTHNNYIFGTRCCTTRLRFPFFSCGGDLVIARAIMTGDGHVIEAEFTRDHVYGIDAREADNSYCHI